jgi:hypothetical protein
MHRPTFDDQPELRHRRRAISDAQPSIFSPFETNPIANQTDEQKPFVGRGVGILPLSRLDIDPGRRERSLLDVADKRFLSPAIGLARFCTQDLGRYFIARFELVAIELIKSPAPVIRLIAIDAETKSPGSIRQLFGFLVAKPAESTCSVQNRLAFAIVISLPKRKVTVRLSNETVEFRLSRASDLSRYRSIAKPDLTRREVDWPLFITLDRPSSVYHPGNS